MLNTEAKGPKISYMGVDTVNPMETSLRTLQDSNVERFIMGIKKLEIVYLQGLTSTTTQILSVQTL